VGHFEVRRVQIPSGTDRFRAGSSHLKANLATRCKVRRELPEEAKDEIGFASVGFSKAVYVLYVFQKKSEQGNATPTREVKLGEKRLAQVVELEKPSKKNLG
jgi:hypothetical protein